MRTTDSREGCPKPTRICSNAAREEKKAKGTRTVVTYEVKIGIANTAIASLDLGHDMKSIARTLGFSKRSIKTFITNKNEMEATILSSKTGRAIIRSKRNRRIKLWHLRSLVLKKLASLPSDSTSKIRRKVAQTVTPQFRDWLLQNPGEDADKAELQRLASFQGSRKWTDGVVKQFEQEQQEVVLAEATEPNAANAAQTVTPQLWDWLHQNPGEYADKAELQRMASFQGSRKCTDGVVEQFEQEQQEVVLAKATKPNVSKPARRPKGTDPLFYIEGSEVKKTEFKNYMNESLIMKTVPKAKMAFFRNTNVHHAVPDGFGHVTIQEIGGRLRLGIVVDSRIPNRTLLLLWKGDYEAFSTPLAGLKWNEIGVLWETARIQCNTGGWLVCKVFGRQTAIFDERSQGSNDAQCTASTEGPDLAKLPALEEIVRLDLDNLTYDAIYIIDNKRRQKQPYDNPKKNVYSVPAGKGEPLVLDGKE
jgi:hypothetical protein